MRFTEPPHLARPRSGSARRLPRRDGRSLSAPFLGLLLAVVVASAGRVDANTFEILTRADPGLASGSASGGSGITSVPYNASRVSADGRYFVFTSSAGDLIPGPDNGRTHVYRFDRQTGQIVRASVNDAGQAGDANSYSACISADGSVVVFASDAHNLHPGDTSLASSDTDIFVRDFATNTTHWATPNISAGYEGESTHPVLSADGSTIVFISDSDVLVANQLPAREWNVFAARWRTGEVELVSVSFDGTQGGDDRSGYPGYSHDVSADGRYVVFESDATNLVDQPTSNWEDVFHRDLQTGITTLVNEAVPPTVGTDGRANSPSLSDDGRVVAFVSNALNLPGHDGFSLSENIHVRWMDTGVTAFATPSIDGSFDGGKNCTNPRLSGDGTHVAFECGRINLTDDIPYQNYDFWSNVFVRDLAAETTRLVTIDPTGSLASNGSNSSHQISADGNVVVFRSLASNLVAGAAGFDQADIFVRDVAAATTTLMSRRGTSSDGGNGDSRDPQISSDGVVTYFASMASDLDPGLIDINDADVFVSTTTGTVELVSRRDPSLAVSATAHQFSFWINEVDMSADGRFVVFSSDAEDILPGDFNGASDIFLLDRMTSAISLVSRSRTGGFPETTYFSSRKPAISADGRVVVFESNAFDLEHIDDSYAVDVFAWDRLTDETTLVSVDVSGTMSTGGELPSISGDGTKVVFVSRSSDLTTTPNIPTIDDGVDFQGNPQSDYDVFVRHLDTGTTELVSVDPTGTSSADRDAWGWSIDDRPVISRDGTTVVWRSRATNLHPSAVLTGIPKIFARDLPSQTTHLVTTDGTGTGEADNNSFYFDVSSSGRYISFTSYANNIDPRTATSEFSDVYVRDLTLPSPQLVSVSMDGASGGDDDVVRSRISGNGRHVVFQTHANNLHPDDYGIVENGWGNDLFLRDLDAQTTEIVTVGDGSRSSLNGGPINGFLISDDGNRVAFYTTADEIVTGPAPGAGFDLLLRDRQAGTTELIDAILDGASQSNGESRLRAMSADGNIIAFVSAASDLVPFDFNGQFDGIVYVPEAEGMLPAGLLALLVLAASRRRGETASSGLSRHPGAVLSIGVVALALGGVLVGSPAHAATFNVTEVTDAGDANRGDGVCASILFGGPCTLRAAVQEANALPGHDVIMLPALYFALTIPGIAEDDAITGDLDITDSVSIQGSNHNTTIIDATGLDWAFELFAAGVTFSHFSVQGRGILSVSPDATLTYMGFSDANLTIDSGKMSIDGGFFDFASITNRGRLEASFIDMFLPDTPAVRNTGGSALLDGLAIQFGEWGIWNESGDVRLRHGSLSDVATGVRNDATMVIDDSVFASGGIGIVNSTTGRLILTDSRLEHSDGRGQGVIRNQGVLFATNIQVAFNTSTPTTGAQTSCGAGLHNLSPGVARVTQSTFSGNAVGAGPAGSCSVATGLDILNTVGGYVLAQSTLLLSNASGKPACASGPIASAGYNVDRGSSCGFTGAGDLSNTNVGLALATDGFLEPTPGSIAIGSGAPGCPLTDARGFARKTITPCDRGAIEYAADIACVNGLDDDGDGLIDALDPGCLWTFDNLEVDLAPGDILLTSVDGGQLFSVDPVSGRREVIAAAGGLAGPTGVVRASDGSIYVSSLGAGGTAGGPLMRIDPLTGEQTLIAWDETTLASVTGMLELPNGNLAVTSPGINEVVEVDPTTGAVTTLAAGPTGFDPRGISRDPITGKLFVAASSGADRLFEILGGSAVPVPLAVGATVGLPRDLEVVGDQAYISDSANPDQLLRVDVLTGDVASLTNLKTAPRGVGVEADGSVIVADRTANEIVRVDPDTGAKETFAIGPLIDDAYFVDIVPGPEPCVWTRYASQARLEAAIGPDVEVFDFSSVPLNGRGNAGFSNGHDFGPFTWTSLSLGSDIDLLGNGSIFGTLWVSNEEGSITGGWPGGFSGAGTPQNDDDFRLDFATGQQAAGIEIVDSRVEPGERIEFRDDRDQVIASFELPGDASGVGSLSAMAGFVGLAVCPGTPLIKSIVVNEGATVGTPQNDSIGFTNVVYVPEPEFVWGLGAGLAMLVGLGRRRRRTPWPLTE